MDDRKDGSMNYKVFGAFFIVIGCGGWGFLMAGQYLSKIKSLRQIVSALEYMTCELQYRATPLPQLCMQTAENCNGKIRYVFCELSKELDAQISPNVSCCMDAVLAKPNDLMPTMENIFRQLGTVLGKYDIQGQLTELDGIRQECRQMLNTLQCNRDANMRSYQTLGLCAGAAIAIIFI